MEVVLNEMMSNKMCNDTVSGLLQYHESIKERCIAIHDRIEANWSIAVSILLLITSYILHICNSPTCQVTFVESVNSSQWGVFTW